MINPEQVSPDPLTYRLALASEFRSKADVLALAAAGYVAGYCVGELISDDAIDPTNALVGGGAFFGTQATIYAVVAAKRYKREKYRADEEALPGRPDVSEGIIALLEETKLSRTGQENSTGVLLKSIQKELLFPLASGSVGLLTFEAPYYTAEDQQLFQDKSKYHNLGRIMLSVPLDKDAKLDDLLTGKIDTATIVYHLSYNEEETDTSPKGLNVSRYVQAISTGSETSLEAEMSRKQRKENPPTRRSKTVQSIKHKAKILSDAGYRADARKSYGRKNLEKSIVEGKELEQLIQTVKTSSISKPNTAQL